MPAENVEVLRPRLEEAQKALDEALNEACDTNLESVDAPELMRLEESLTVAREAARRVIGVLQRLDRDPREMAGARRDAHRIFVDDSGVQWDAFVVYPSLASKTRGRLQDAYKEGWLAIQCDKGVKRLAPIPQGWRECSHGEFCRLADKAEIVPRRTMRKPNVSATDREVRQPTYSDNREK